MRAYQFREQARNLLKNLSGKYALFFLPSLLSLFSIFLTLRETLLNMEGFEISVSASIFPLLISLLLSLFISSASFAMLDVIRKKRQNVAFSDSNLAFSSEIFWKLLLTMLFRWLYLAFWSVIWVFGLIILMFGFGLYSLQSLSISAVIMIILGVVLYLLGLGILIVKQYSYTFAEYLLYDHLSHDTYSGPAQLLAESQQLMKGYRWKLFCLEMSFIGWYVLSGVTMGLLNFYMLPYLTTTRVLFYDHLIEVNNITADQ